MNKQILLPTAVKIEMMRTFGTNKHALRRALNYQINSRQAKMLREEALRRGGLVYFGARSVADAMPECETAFDHSRERVIQCFGNRLRLEVCMKKNTAKIFVDENPVARFDNLTLDKWKDVVCAVQEMFEYIGR